jgi:hypothetical protein
MKCRGQNSLGMDTNETVIPTDPLFLRDKIRKKIGDFVPEQWVRRTSEVGGMMWQRKT